MRVLTYQHDDYVRPGALVDGRVVDLSGVAPDILTLIKWVTKA